MTAPTPDIFTNVHKGIRSALFAACSALGRATGDAEREAAARSLLREALRFVAHHGENEDELLLPLLSEAAEVAARMRSAHAQVDAARHALTAALEAAASEQLYHQACAFLALYLEHMRDEECELEPAIRAALTVEQLSAFGRLAVERTAPADQRMMLAWMVPAMARRDAELLLAKLPPALAEELRALDAA